MIKCSLSLAYPYLNWQLLVQHHLLLVGLQRKNLIINCYNMHWLYRIEFDKQFLKWPLLIRSNLKIRKFTHLVANIKYRHQKCLFFFCKQREYPKRVTPTWKFWHILKELISHSPIHMETLLNMTSTSTKGDIRIEKSRKLPLENSNLCDLTKHRKDEHCTVLASTKSPNRVTLTSIWCKRYYYQLRL